MENILLQESVDFIEHNLARDLGRLVVERLVFGLFFTGVKLNNGQGGLCATPVKSIPEAVCCPSSLKAMPLSGKLAGRPVREYLADLGSGNVLKRAGGIAVLNALAAAYWARFGNGAMETGVDAFDTVDIDPQKKAVVVGALVPMLKKLIDAGADFTILEKDQRTLKPYEMQYYLSDDHAPDVVPQADLLVITGTTVLNGTLPGLLALATPYAEVVVAGPTASMLPEPFFTRGVSVFGGITVTKPDELLDVISEGGSGYHFFGKSAERMVFRPGGRV